MSVTRFTYAGGKFSFGINPPKEIAAIGGGWMPDETGWHTVDPRIAQHFKHYADQRAQRQLGRIFLERKHCNENVLTWPESLTPKNYQKYSALYALERNRSYLALEPGLGKTIVAALISSTLPDQPFVYVCPPYLVETVAAELQKWDPHRYLRIYPEPPAPRRHNYIVPDSQLHDDILRGNIGKLLAQAHAKGMRPVLIVDEAHRFRRLSSRRTRALFQAYVPAFKHIVFMSGTPMPNRPFELWPILSECAPETIDFVSEVEYGQRYCGGRYEEGKGWNFNFASNVEDLANRVHGKFMLRLRKEDVLPELPAKIEEIVVIGAELPVTIAKLDAQLLRQASPEDIMAASLAPQVRHTEETLPLSTYRRLLGTLKAEASEKFIRGVLEDTEDNILVFAFHSEAILYLKERLQDYSPPVIIGSTPAEVRKENVRKFQDKDLGHRLLIANYVAGGIGFDLTKASRVIFVEASWNPADNQQASDRPHRVGQKDVVLVQYLVFKNSLDRQIIETNIRKEQTTRHI